MTRTRKALVTVLWSAAFLAGAYAGHNTRIFGPNYLQPDSYVGIAWDIGGIELHSDHAEIFICPAVYNYETGKHWDNPLADLFPSIVADC